MALQKLNWGDYDKEKDSLYKKAPEGTYEVQLSKWEYRASAQKGTPGINFEFRIVNSEDGEYDNLPIFHWVSWDSAFLTQALLALCGKDIGNFDPDPEAVEDGSDEAFESLVGETVEAAVIEDEYEGKTSNKIHHFILA